MVNASSVRIGFCLAQIPEVLSSIMTAAPDMQKCSLAKFYNLPKSLIKHVDLYFFNMRMDSLVFVIQR